MDKGVHTFPSIISPKVIVILKHEFDLAYYDVTVQYVCHYSTETHLLDNNYFIIKSNRLKRSAANDDDDNENDDMCTCACVGIYIYIYTKIFQNVLNLTQKEEQ